MEDNILNIEKYFKKRTFVIPNYQRGYKWGVESNDGKKNSVEFFSDSLIEAFKKGHNEYFIEAVTVVQENENDPIILVDGQQRTITLFLLFVALEDFSFLEEIELNYEVREDSHAHLQNLIAEKGLIKQNVKAQDIYYFNKALGIIKKQLNGFSVKDNHGNEIKKDIKSYKVEFNGDDRLPVEKTFLEYLKGNINLLFYKISKDKAVNTFIALNGLKAIMKDEELIKSDLLNKSSWRQQAVIPNNTKPSCEELLKTERDNLSIKWKENENRGRLARNWDRWLYWWNQEEVKNYYGTGNKHPLYYLLVTYWKINKEGPKDERFTFEQFKKEFISDKAKYHFEGLRKLQKKFEDLYNSYQSHNFLGLILKTNKSREEALHYFLDSKVENKLSLKEYAKWSLVKATHFEIINNTTEKTQSEENGQEQKTVIKNRKAQEAIALANEKYVYLDENDAEINDERKENTSRFLLLLNLLEDNKLKRKFDFSIWGNHSLEHIYPKSKKNRLAFTNEEFQEGSIHCIGNLVLLYGHNNSEFGNKEFEEKKNTYFNMSEEFKSRNLLHTISVFAKSVWKEKEIIENKKTTINLLNNYYDIK